MKYKFCRKIIFVLVSLKSVLWKSRRMFIFKKLTLNTNLLQKAFPYSIPCYTTNKAQILLGDSVQKPTHTTPQTNTVPSLRRAFVDVQYLSYWYKSQLFGESLSGQVASLLPSTLNFPYNSHIFRAHYSPYATSTPSSYTELPDILCLN